MILDFGFWILDWDGRGRLAPCRSSFAGHSAGHDPQPQGLRQALFITDNARIYVNMAEIYEQQGSRQTALDYHEAAIEIAPDNAEAKQGLERLRAS